MTLKISVMHSAELKHSDYMCCYEIRAICSVCMSVGLSDEQECIAPT